MTYSNPSTGFVLLFFFFLGGVILGGKISPHRGVWGLLLTALKGSITLDRAQGTLWDAQIHQVHPHTVLFGSDSQSPGSVGTSEVGQLTLVQVMGVPYKEA